MNQFNALSKLQKEELTQILTDAFLTRQDLGSQTDIQGFKEFVDKNNINQDLQNLNLTISVLEFLYENSSKSKDFITFVKGLKKMIAIWQNSGRTNEEILEMIKCL
jgi:hypothetical protein